MTFVTDLYELNNFIRKSNFRARQLEFLQAFM